MKIALSGKMMSGKTIVANYLVSKYGFIELAFADKLKDIAVDLFGMNRQYKDRNLLQMVGNKLREIDFNVWTRYLLPYIKINMSKDIVVSDVRFKNEFKALYELGFIMIRCYVGKKLQEERIIQEMPDMPSELCDDISEVDLDDVGRIWSGIEWHHIIMNNGCTMEELLLQVDDMIRFERGRNG